MASYETHAKEAPDRIRELEKWGAVFDRTTDGRILQRNFGGHRYPRPHATRLASSNPEVMREMKRIFWRGTEEWEGMMAELATMSGQMIVSEFTRDALKEFRRR